MRKLLIATALAAALAVAGCKVSNAPESGTNQVAAVQGDWPAFVNTFIEASFRANPGFAVSQGRHEYDGQIADLSPAGISSEVDRLKKAIADAQGFTDDKLAPEQRFERDYLIAVAKGQLFWIDPTGADQLHHNPASYLGYVDPSVYVTVPYAPKEQRLKSYIKFLQNVPRAAEQMRANIQTPMATSFIDYAKSAFGGFVTYYPGDGIAAWKGVGTPADQQALKDATANAVKAMQDTVAWVESQRAASKPNFALGKDKFQRMLADTEMVTVPVERLEQIGRADLASNQKLLGEACSRYAPGQTIQACMLKMNADKPADGPVAEARRQLPMLKQFLIQHDIVSIPGPEEARSRNRRRTTGRTRPTSTSPALTRRGFHRSFTSPRLTRVGRRRSRTPSSRARTTCSTRLCMRCGQVTSSTSSTPTARRTSSAGCSSAMPSRRAGRIIPRR
jgi:hypothetical protein